MVQNSDDSSGLLTFIDGLNLGEPVSLGSVKHFHKKSRTGCQRCRSRRVKCDEAKPRCGRCEKHGAECVYDRIGATTASKKPPVKRKATREPATQPGFVQELGESEERRLEELELLHYYMSETGPSIPYQPATSNGIFTKIIPRMAIKSKALLYSVMAIVALHKVFVGNETATRELVVKGREQYDRYFPLAIRLHRQDCDNMRADNIDMIFLTACVVRIMGCYNCSVRSLEPYTPPTEWFRFLKSHFLMYQAGWKMAGEDRDTHVSTVVREALDNWQPFQDDKAAETKVLNYIFESTGTPDTDHMNGSAPRSEGNINSAYMTVLRYLNGLIVNMKQGKDRIWVLQQLSLTLLILEEGFFDLLENFDPKALVLIAHFFSILTILDQFWYIGRGGHREVEAIVKFLPQEWQHMLVWPQQICGMNLRDYPAVRP